MMNAGKLDPGIGVGIEQMCDSLRTCSPREMYAFRLVLEVRSGWLGF